MSIDGIKARLGSLGPTRMAGFSPGVRRLLEDDMPKLLELAEEVRREAQDNPGLVASVFRGAWARLRALDAPGA